MIRVGYKVVTQLRTSCLALGKYKLHYPLGEFVHAPGGTLGIMVFDTWINASKFARVAQLILLVVYDSDDISEYTGPISAWPSEIELQRYYIGKDWVDTRPMPLGTVLCHKVKVIAKEEVTPS